MRVVSTMTTVEWLPVGGPTATRTWYPPRRTYPMIVARISLGCQCMTALRPIGRWRQRTAFGREEPSPTVADRPTLAIGNFLADKREYVVSRRSLNSSR